MREINVLRVLRVKLDNDEIHTIWEMHLGAEAKVRCPSSAHCQQGREQSRPELARASPEGMAGAPWI